jgi:putative membrane protein
MMGGYGMGDFGFGGIFMSLWWILIVIGLVVLVRWMISSGANPATDSALKILKERYARGEIDEQEYQKRKQDLSQ